MFTTVCLTLIFIFGTMRIMAYRQLGRDFIYKLAPPPKLITAGLYRIAIRLIAPKLWLLFCLAYSVYVMMPREHVSFLT